MLEQIEVSTQDHQAFHDITAQVQQIVKRSGVREGMCFIFCPHTTAGVTLNENWDSDVQHDIGVGLDALSPRRPEYRHGEGNSPAHLKSSLVGAAQFVPIVGAKLALGTWQGVYLAEFDGPRRRKVLVNVNAG
jgi:secondary thiamine-phosphate synthase enzyme